MLTYHCETATKIITLYEILSYVSCITLLSSNDFDLICEAIVYMHVKVPIIKRSTLLSFLRFAFGYCE